MIELRWLEVLVGFEDITHAQWVPKLQFRCKDNWGGHNDEPDWGEWQDVPTVRLP